LLEALALANGGHSDGEKENFRAFDITILIQFVIPRHGRGAERWPLESAFDHAKNLLKSSLGVTRIIKFERWTHVVKSNHFTGAFAREDLSRGLERLIDYGGVMTLDEKLRGYGGDAPCTVYCPGKPEPKGLWVSQLGVFLSSTNLPYVTRVYPFTHCTAVGESQAMSSVVEWATSAIPRFPDGGRPLVVMDARYLDKAGFDLLTMRGIKFLASINPRWFPEFAAALSDVKQRGDWGALRSENGQVLFVSHFTAERVGKKHLLTNALRERPAPLPPAKCPGSDEYQVTFSILDEFNQRMAGHCWPYRRMDWELALHDLLLTIVLFDLYHLHCEITGEVKPLTAAMRELAIAMYGHTLG